MARLALTDGSGRWFDSEKATVFREGQRFDGRNHVSKATGDQWHHEQLWCTKSGVWVLDWWSDWQGSSEEGLKEIDAAHAACWLIANDWTHDEVAERLPATLVAQLTAAWEGSEL